jgi:hypothetical protein
MPFAWLACLPLLLCLLFAGKLLAILAGDPDQGSAAATFVLLLGCATLALWLFRLQPASHAAAEPAGIQPATHKPEAPAPSPPARPAERRRHPRRAVDWAVEIAWSPAMRQATRLHDLSRGGARLQHSAPEPAGRRGLLHVPGLSLPVPFTVVDARPDSGLHLRFDLEGMGLDALEAQLEALCSVADNAS